MPVVVLDTNILISAKQSITGSIFKGEKMPTSKSYHSYLIQSLKDPLEAAAYLNIILEDCDLEHIVLALKNVAEAQESLTDRSNSNQFNWEEYSQLFSNQEPTELLAIVALLNQLGLKLSVTVKPKQTA